jgi:hypothetical protein
MTNPPRLGRSEPRRRLFLDDDPARAEIFQAENPEAVWVQTARECLDRLAEPWDEVHLDHDLGGEHFVDTSREDCGMEVVRWLCLAPRPHLRRTHFFVHSHNFEAACAMAMQLSIAGYRVDNRPFGAPSPPASLAHFSAWTSRLRSRLDRLRVSILRLAGSPEATPKLSVGRDSPPTEAEPPVSNA